MPMNKQYHPDYRALYPGVSIEPVVLAALKKSDRKMEYLEWELKHARVRRNRKGDIVRATPPREYSLENLQAQSFQFAGAGLSPEEVYLMMERRQELHRCLALLDKKERELIHALYHDNLTERQYAAKVGLSQKTVNKRKRRILAKLRKNL